MTIRHIGTLPHWNYFLSLEEDVGRLSRWIEISTANEPVYSIELARLLMAAAQEADVVAKALCKAIAPAARAGSIKRYQEVLVGEIPALPNARVDLPRYGKSFRPWENWRQPETPPDWWTGNNKVKHHRGEHFEEANLKNVLNAVAGLLVLLLLHYGVALGERIIMPKPQLWEPWSFGMLQDDGLLLSPPNLV